MSDLLHRVHACNNAALPGPFLLLTLGGVPSGGVSPTTVAALLGTVDGDGSGSVAEKKALRVRSAAGSTY